MGSSREPLYCEAEDMSAVLLAYLFVGCSMA